MGFRFRKSFKLGKNTRFNVNKKSVGFSFGTKGFRKSFNTSGRRTTTFSIPGTGLSYVSTKSSKNKKRNHSASHSMSNRTTILSFLTAPVLIIMIVFTLFIGCSDDSSKKEKNPVSSSTSITTTSTSQTTTTLTETTTTVQTTTQQSSPTQATSESLQATTSETTQTTVTTTTETQINSHFVLNSGTMKAHCPGCSSISKIKAGNKKEYSGTVDELKKMGYSPCGKCQPW